MQLSASIEDNQWMRSLQDRLLLLNDLREQFLHFTYRRTVRNPDRYGVSHLAFGMGPVDDFLLEELAVRHEHFHAVKSLNERASHPDGSHFDALSVNLDKVADTDRTIKEQYDAAVKVVDQVLCTKNRYDGERTPRNAKTASGLFTETVKTKIRDKEDEKGNGPSVR
jgi:hypothetical protein